MPITMNHFKCQNGHTFEANAKLRTRCPECGISTKRSFDKVVETIVSPIETPKPVESPTTPKPHKTGPVLVRQGRPRMATKKVVAPVKKAIAKPVGAKVLSAGLVKSNTIKTRGTTPVIKKRPVKTAVARGIKGHEQVIPYWHEIARKYGL